MPRPAPHFFLRKNCSLLQYGGPDGELGASMRYLSQRYTMPYPEAKGVLTDIGTEEASWPPILVRYFSSPSST